MGAPWIYRRSDVGIETGWHSSTAPNGLHGHFHDETQIVAVLEGWRQFLTPHGRLRCESGQIAIMPAGVVHAASGSRKSRVLNLYVAPNAGSVRGVVTPRVIQGRSASSVSQIVDVVGACRRETHADRGGSVAAMTAAVTRSSASIRRLADAFGYSPDGFIRRFTRVVGMTPAQYSLAHRLAVARSLLRAGVGPAEAACAGVFSDQSHLGRMFLRAYGATPAAYRAGLARQL